MSSRLHEGAFPAAGPVVYLAQDAESARAMLAGRRAGYAQWFHATCLDGAIQAAHRGLIPSCWRGGDTCAVFGVDALRDVHSHHGEWVLKIRSCALPGQLKAWWVPPERIMGAWHAGEFISSRALRTRPPGPPPAFAGCPCELAGVVAEQIACWANPTSTRGPTVCPWA